MGIVYVKDSSIKRKARKPRKTIRGSSRNWPDWSDYRNPKLPETKNIVPGIVAEPASIMAHRHKESPEVVEAIDAKAKRIGPHYNKGAAQYITDGTDKHTLGRKI